MTADSLVVDVSRDWALAREVQKRFMQGLEPDLKTLDYCARCRQMFELGGDCYGFVPLGDQRLALAIGDASGKGLAAALMIANVQSSLRTAALFRADDGAAVLRAVNCQVYASSPSDRYATVFYGVFDSMRRILRYVNAGHNPPLVFRQDGRVDRLEASGAPVGMFADGDFEERIALLHPGDVVVAYTDGVTEALNSAGEEWGVKGLRGAAAGCGAQSAADIVRAIFASMDEFSQGKQSDDATVAVLRVH